jgi:hypothetical protein
LDTGVAGIGNTDPGGKPGGVFGSGAAEAAIGAKPAANTITATPAATTALQPELRRAAASARKGRHLLRDDMFFFLGFCKKNS